MGYQVLPGSIDDMLAPCRAVGVEGNVNFDGVGYEKLTTIQDQPPPMAVQQPAG